MEKKENQRSRPAQLKKLRTNQSGQLTLKEFWHFYKQMGIKMYEVHSSIYSTIKLYA